MATRFPAQPDPQQITPLMNLVEAAVDFEVKRAMEVQQKESAPDKKMLGALLVDFVITQVMEAQQQGSAVNKEMLGALLVDFVTHVMNAQNKGSAVDKKMLETLLDTLRAFQKCFGTAMSSLQAAVDYVIMLAMQMKQIETDKEEFAAILDTLGAFNEVLGTTGSESLKEMLEQRLKSSAR